MSDAPSRVTVVIPVWDQPYVDALPDAVASARHQDPRPEVVVVDNASIVPLPELHGVEVVRSPRRVSRGAARNLGLGRVGTRYVLFLDADDALTEGSLAFLEAELARDPGAVACAGSILDPDTGERHRIPRRAAYPLSRLGPCFAVANAIWSLYPSQGGAIMRTAQVRAAGGYGDADSSEDWVLRAALAFRGRIALVDRPVFLYTQRRDGAASSTADLARGARMVRRRLRSDRGVPWWGRAMLPAIALAQLVALRLMRPVVRGLRPLRGAPGLTS